MLRPSPTLRLPALAGVAAAGGVVLVALAAGLAPSLLPSIQMEQDARWIATAAVFAASYLALAVGRARLRIIALSFPACPLG